MPTSQAVADVKKYLPQLNVTHDELLGLIEARARALIDAYYRLKMGPGWPGFGDWSAPEAKPAYGWQTNTLWLQPHQIGSVSAVHYTAIPSDGIPVATTPVVPATWVEDLSTGFLLYPNYGWGSGTYMVTAVWGFGPMPPEVYQVLLELMINIWRAKDRSADAEGNPVYFNTKLTDAQKEVLSSIIVPWQAKSGTIKVYRATI